MSETRQKSKLLIVNGVITVIGFALDAYGVYDMTSVGAAYLGLGLGALDCVTFVFMREEIKKMIGRWSFGREAGMQRWVEEMLEGKPQVTIRVSGAVIVARMVKTAAELGYEICERDERPTPLGTLFTVTFSKREDKQ